MKFEKRRDVLIEGAIVLKLICKVEDEIGCEALQLLPQQIEIVEDGEVFHHVTEFGKGGEDVGFGFPIIGFQFGAQILIQRRGRDRIEQGEDFEFLLQGYFVRLNLPVNRWFITSVVL